MSWQELVPSCLILCRQDSRFDRHCLSHLDRCFSLRTGSAFPILLCRESGTGDRRYLSIPRNISFLTQSDSEKVQLTKGITVHFCIIRIQFVKVETVGRARPRGGHIEGLPCILDHGLDVFARVFRGD